MTSRVEATESQYAHLNEELPLETKNKIQAFSEEKQRNAVCSQFCVVHCFTQISVTKNRITGQCYC